MGFSTLEPRALSLRGHVGPRVRCVQGVHRVCMVVYPGYTGWYIPGYDRVVHTQGGIYTRVASLSTYPGMPSFLPNPPLNPP